MAKHTVSDDGDPRKYYAAIPNIVFTLGLNPYELALYAYLKKVAGEDGTCWKSTATIAKELKVGVGTVSRTKTLLAELRPGLGGKPLIVINVEMQNGGNPNHAITITDIWPENMAELARVRAGKATRSGVEGARSTGEQRVPETKATRSTGDDKEEPIKKNPQEDKRDFLSNLRADPFYSHVDFDTEIERMRRWLSRPENKKRRMTERFVLNWLEKIDRPVAQPPVVQPDNGDRATREAELKKKMGWDKLERTA